MPRLIHDVTTVTFSDSDLLHPSDRPDFTAGVLARGSSARDIWRLERFHKPGDCVSVALGHPAKCIARALGLTTMPKNGLGDVARSPIVQQLGVSADCGQEANPPEW